MTTTILDTSTHKIIVGGNPSDALTRKVSTEKSWRDLELLRTDNLVLLPDYPVDLLPYRAALRGVP